MKKMTKFLLVFDILAIIGLFVVYGPITIFKDTLVTTAMTTMSHQYLAKVFYTDEMIYLAIRALKERGDVVTPEGIREYLSDSNNELKSKRL